MTGPYLVVWVDPDFLTRFDVTMDTVVRRLKESGLEVLSRESTRVAVRGGDPEHLQTLVIQRRDGVPIELRDIAMIEARR